MHKYSVSYSLLPATKNDGSHTIRLRVSSCGKRLTVYLPYSVTEDGWDRQRCKAKPSYQLGRTTAAMINKAITASTNTIDDYFTKVDLEKSHPDLSELKTLITGKHDEVERNQSTFTQVMAEFVQVNGEANSWTRETYGKFENLKRHLMTYKPTITMEDFNERGLAGFINYLHSIELRNTTIAKQYSFLKWFLRWCAKKKYITCHDFETFTPRLKGVSSTPRAQLFLEWPELVKLYNYDFGDRHKGLAAVRDVFLFQCFTGLRYSDVRRLRRENVTYDYITIVTQKTSERLTIELNKFSRAILEKYSFRTFRDNLALPVISNVKMNTELKEACRLAGIDTPVQVVYYKGADRHEMTCPKYQMVSTHCGRHTFIVHALNLGIPVEVVTQLTGHSSYRAMKPYVNITNNAKRQAMDRFDALDTKEEKEEKR